MLIHNRIEGHVDIPVEQVWTFVADFTTLPLWHVGVVATKDIDGKMTELGSKAVMTLKLFDGPHDFAVEVTAIEPLKLCTQIGQQVDGPMRFTTTVTYTPVGKGLDSVWEQETELPDGLPGPMGNATFVERYLGQMLRQSMENLALLVELLAAQPV